MTKVETPTDLTLYVQFDLHPFPEPQDGKQKSANSKWAQEEAKKILAEVITCTDDISVICNYNGKILLIISKPEQTLEDDIKLWEKILTMLKSSDKVVSITVFVNNDISEKIAMNLEFRVNRPWYTGYRGFNAETTIYHK